MATHDRLVIGIDFGTTFSGVAAAYSGKAESADEIQVIKIWPGGSGIISDKVPSELAYGPSKTIKPVSRSVTPRPNSNALASNSQNRQSASFNLNNLSLSLAQAIREEAGQADSIRWGYQLRQDEVRLRCMKLFLDPQQDLPEYISRSDMNEQLRRSKKDAETAVEDYLTELFKHARQTLVKRFTEYFFSTTPIEVIMTVPAVWSDTAKQLTLGAAQRAGKAIGASASQQLTLISEPEAAAVYTLQAIQPNALSIGDNFVVCDAGGGTVDLISYEIDQISPLRIHETTKGSGKCCGSAFLNIRFEEYVRTKLGDATFLNVCEKNPRSWLAALRNFEEYVKRNFDPDEETEFSIPFPGVPDNPSAGVEQGFLVVPSAEVGKLFQPILDDVIGLVDQQIINLKAQGKKVSAIVLVGGFGQSDCLHKALKQRFGEDTSSPPAYSELPTSPSSGRQGIKVMQPGNAWTAVVRGAVLRGLEGRELVTSRKARNHYGVACRPTYDSSIHPASCKAWNELDERWEANSRMRWYITKGQTISSSEPVSFRFYRNFESHDTKNCIEELVVCKDDVAPQGYDADSPSTQVLCKLPIDLSVVPARHWETRSANNGSQFARLDFSLGMQINSGQITFDYQVDGESYGKVEAKFE